MTLRKGYFRGFHCGIYLRCALWGAIFSLLVCLSAGPASAADDLQDHTIWTLEASEGNHHLHRHARVQGAPRGPSESGQAWEDHVELATAEAAWVDFVAPLRPLAVIDELELSVSVSSSRHGVRLIAEVVLPHARDPMRDEPLRVRLFGPTYTRVGAWERLTLEGLPLQVERSVRTMQLTTAETINSRGAYIDRLRLRVRPGRGETSLHLASPVVRGAVIVQREDGSPAPESGGGVVLASGQRPTGTGSQRPNEDVPPQVQLTGGVLHVAGAALFPRAVEHPGGPIRGARQWGCNVVVLASTPTRAQEREAEAADLWLVAPPPDPQTLARTGSLAAFPRVIAWHVGRRLTTVDLEPVREWARLIRQLDPARGRPIAASVHFGHRAFSRVLDIVVLEREPVGGAVPLDRFIQHLAAERRLVLPGKPVWTWIQTQLPAEVVYQAGCLVRQERSAVDSRLPVDEISRLTWIALAQGSDGLIFGGPSVAATGRGDGPVPLELQLLNRQLDLLNPVLTATGSTHRIADLAPGLSAGILSSGRTHWVLPWYSEGGSQVPFRSEDSLLDSRSGPIASSFVVPGVAEPSDGFLVTTTGAHRLTATREAGGVRIATGPLLPRDAILLSQDALAAQRVRGKVAAQAAEAARDERALLHAARIEDESASAGTGDTAGFGGLQRSSSGVSSPRTSPEHLSATGTAGTPRSDAASVRELRLSLARTRSRETAYGARGSLRSCPLDRFEEFTSLDASFRLLDRRPLPTPNLLPAGDFEDLGIARQAGWRHVRLAQRGTHAVDVVGENAHGGASCVRIGSGEESGSAAGTVVMTAWLNSPDVPLNAGDVIRITGWVRGSEPRPGEAPPRAVIEDTLGGEPLALSAAPGPQWQPFVMYRATDAPHAWSIRLSCRGGGAVYFDDLVVQRVGDW